MEPIKKIEYLIADTTAFIQNANLQEVANNIITCPEVVTEITNKRQLRRLVVLPYDLVVKDVFPENVCSITDFSKKTGDYRSLSATDIKVMALTLQLEKEKVGISHLRTEPIFQKSVNVTTHTTPPDVRPDITGFYMPKTAEAEDSDSETNDNDSESDEYDYKAEEAGLKVNEVDSKADDMEQNEKEADPSTDHLKCDKEKLDNLLKEKFGNLDIDEDILKEDQKEIDVILPHKDTILEDEDYYSDSEEDDDEGWITPSNVKLAKKQLKSDLVEEKEVKVACMTTDFAMQNVLRQMNLNVSALDGRIIKQLRTFILRCYACFKTTSIMTKRFCPNCGNDTLKKVAVSLNEEGKMEIHINGRKPLTARGKKYSIPKIRGGKHPNNPILVEDQPMADNKPTRLARMKNNPLDTDYIAGYSPFIMRDVNSKSAQLCIRPGQGMKNWMRKNPNESRRKRK